MNMQIFISTHVYKKLLRDRLEFSCMEYRHDIIDALMNMQIFIRAHEYANYH